MSAVFLRQIRKDPVQGSGLVISPAFISILLDPAMDWICSQANLNLDFVPGEKNKSVTEGI
jgi:hypothetical protein